MSRPDDALSRGPVFVTGHQRSGKTLVRWLLASTGNIAMSRRTQMWPRFGLRYGSLADDRNLTICLDAMLARRQIADLGLDLDQVREEFAEGAPTYGRLFETMHTQFADSFGLERWGDQSSGLEAYAAHIMRSYPDARIIHTIRDPLDAYWACVSKYPDWARQAGKFAEEWSHSAVLADKNESEFPSRYLVIKYEDLVHDPKGQCEQLLRFVGEEFSQHLLRLDAADRYGPERVFSGNGWAITGEHVGEGVAIDACAGRFLSSSTEAARSLWSYPSRPRHQNRLDLRCIPFHLVQSGQQLLYRTRSWMRPSPRHETGSSTVMSHWHRLTDSDGFRQFVKRGPARHVFRSHMFRYLDTQRRRLLAARASRREPHLFDDVQTFVLFVGHNKSGTSLLGSLLDAHPSMVVSDETDALRFFEAGLARKEVFRILYRASQSETRKGRVTARRLGGYSYNVPGLWQGRTSAPRLVGDSMSGTTTRKLASHPVRREKVEDRLGEVALKLIHVIRNPFDPISLMMIRGGRTVQNSVDHYFDACARLEAIRRAVKPGQLLPVYYENLVANPVEELKRVCRFLDVDVDDSYLQACAAIVVPSFEDSRNKVEWAEPWISEIEDRIHGYAFLEGYTLSGFERRTT